MVRPLTDGQGRRFLMQRSVSMDNVHGQPEAYESLENQIRAGVRLARRYGDDYPDSLFRLVGYDVDTETPYLLCEPPRGEPVGRAAGQLLLSQRHDFEVGLFRCLLLVADSGMVHAGITPETVLWDGRRVFVDGFSEATVIGEQYFRRAQPPWSAPALRSQGGVADPGDDIWSAAMVVYHVATGKPLGQLTGAPELDATTALGGLLDGAFEPAPAARPPADRMLRRLRAEVQLPPGPAGPDPAFEAGCREFEREREAKSRSMAKPGARDKAPVSGSASGVRLAWGLVPLLLVLLGVAFYFLER